MADAAAAGPEPAGQPCNHPDFDAFVDVGRIEPDPDGMPKAFVADIRINCGRCKVAFEFMGLPAGLSYEQPRVSVGGEELRAPIRPAGTDRPCSVRLPSFSVSMYAPDGGNHPDTGGQVRQ